jgi:hypothetical protein
LKRAAEVFRNYAGGAYEMADEKYMRAAAGAVLALAAAEEINLSQESVPRIHNSDCAIYNEPAFPAGPCDCGAAEELERKEMGR